MREVARILRPAALFVFTAFEDRDTECYRSPSPSDKYPSRADSLKYEYIKMSQLCEIAEQKKVGRSRASNAFGGDKGQYKVITERMARAVMHQTKPSKCVKTAAVISYLKEFGIEDW